MKLLQNRVPFSAEIHRVGIFPLQMPNIDGGSKRALRVMHCDPTLCVHPGDVLALKNRLFQ